MDQYLYTTLWVSHGSFGVSYNKDKVLYEPYWTALRNDLQCCISNAYPDACVVLADDSLPTVSRSVSYHGSNPTVTYTMTLPCDSGQTIATSKIAALCCEAVYVWTNRGDRALTEWESAYGLYDSSNWEYRLDRVTVTNVTSARSIANVANVPDCSCKTQKYHPAMSHSPTTRN